MLALSYLYHMLATFRPLFSRHTPWLLFCVIILGFIGTPHLEGLTSLCRFWFMQEADYHRLLHFFHSSAWCLDDLVRHWSHLVWSQQVAVTVEGRPAGRSYRRRQGCPAHAGRRHFISRQ
jgi:hypothetical protein